jgi:cyanophycinase
MSKQLSRVLLLFVSVNLFTGCAKQTTLLSNDNPLQTTPGGIALKPAPAVVTYLTGSAADITTGTAKPGLILMGGGTDVDAAIQWFLQRAGGGDVVVIRATGADGYNQYMYDMGGVNSVETIIIDSRAKADLAEVTQKIRNAEALFIAGGDQWDYVNYWKNTGTEDAINYLLNTKKVTVGGTSAGLAVMSAIYYSAATGSVTSDQALKDPYHRYITLGQNDFINAPLLQNTITDSHYTQRDRQGRHITFMARMMKDFAYSAIKGIGIDEQTAVCIDETGSGKVYGINQAYFLQNETSAAETCIAKTPLTWNRGGLAVKAYKISASLTGNGSFNAASWTFSGGTAYHYYVTNGTLFQN